MPPSSHSGSIRAARASEQPALNDCLLSVLQDAAFVRSVCTELFPSLPSFANLRSGPWYLPEPSGGTAYFKSSDGHSYQWDVPLSRQNMHFAFAAARSGGAVLVDASSSACKPMPDSLLKTVPLWAAVISSATLKLDARDCLVLPPQVPEHERAQMEKILPMLVNRVLRANPRLDELRLQLCNKPIKPLWISQQHCGWDAVHNPPPDASSLPFIPLVLVSASAAPGADADARQYAAARGYQYVRGAVDDIENWSLRISSSVFWNNKKWIIEAAMASNARCEQEIKKLLGSQEAKTTVQSETPQYLPRGCNEHVADVDTFIHPLGNTGLHLACADAIGACSSSTDATLPSACVYLGESLPETVLSKYVHRYRSEAGPTHVLHLPVQTSKKDRSGLTRWSACGVQFVLHNLQLGRDVLIACADGRDRSVAFAILTLLLLFPSSCTKPNESVSPACCTSPAAREQMSKEEPRKVLSAVASDAYPAALPSRGMLKQVYAAAWKFEV